MNTTMQVCETKNLNTKIDNQRNTNTQDIFMQAQSIAKSAISNVIRDNINADIEDIINTAYIALAESNNNTEYAYKQVNAYITANNSKRGHWKVQSMEDITIQDEHDAYSDIDSQDAVQRTLKALEYALTRKEYLALLDNYNGLTVTESALKRGINKSTISRQLESARRKAQTIINR